MRVIVPEALHEEGRRRLGADAEVEYVPGIPREELLTTIGEYEALIVRSGVAVDADLIEAGARLKVTGRAGVGVGNIDVDRATEKGKCLGIIGLGRIGREVAKRALSFGMSVLACDPCVSAEMARRTGVELADLLSRADFIMVRTPLTSETRGLIGRREIALMKEGARVINCARGGIVDEQALYEALAAGTIGGAALDVFGEEPPGDSPLLRLENVMATPHLGGSTIDAQVRNVVVMAVQVLAALKGEIVQTAVNQPVPLPEEWKLIGPYVPACETLGRFYAQASPGPVN